VEQTLRVAGPEMAGPEMAGLAAAEVLLGAGPPRGVGVPQVACQVCSGPRSS